MTFGEATKSSQATMVVLLATSLFAGCVPRNGGGPGDEGTPDDDRSERHADAHSHSHSHSHSHAHSHDHSHDTSHSHSRETDSPGGTPDTGGDMDAGVPDAAPDGATTADTASNADATDESTPCIGGGECYEKRICEPTDGSAVRDRDALVDAVGRAGDGDVVFVAGDAEIDLGNTSLDPGDGVTIASDRGCDGSEGALLYSDDSDARLIVTSSDDVRVTGLRVGGRYRDHRGENSLYDGDDWDAGIRIGGENGTVDNNEVYGFRYVGVDVEGAGAHVHHNTIHYNAGDGLGYGVLSGTGAEPIPLIEYNYFEFNRHSVATHSDRSYEVRFNVHGPNMPDHHIFDVHGTKDECGQHCGGTAGGEIRIHHNTVMAAKDPVLSIRGVPETGAWIESNWMYHQKDGAVIQEKEAPFENVTMQDNHYGEDEPASCDIGAPRSGC